MAEAEDSSLLNKTINEEYKLWKRNAPVLYDLVITHALDWPTLSVQWFQDRQTNPDKDYTTHRLLIGTHTSDAERNYVQIATVNLPKPNAELNQDNYDEQRGEIGSHTDVAPRVKIIQSIPHDGEVNRARYMPQNQDLIATKTPAGSVYIFDRTKHPSQPTEDVCKPNIILNGHTKEGYGLSWNPTDAGKGQLVSASEDTTVCHWDINAYTKANATIEPLAIYKGHTAVVEDVQWHATKPEVFGSVGDDRKLLLWDTRAPATPTSSVEAHEAEVNSLAFSPASETLLLTASSDKTIGLWDLRNLKSKLHTFIGHEDEVLHLAFSPHHETVFASGSSDRRVNVWNMASIGLEQTPEDAEDGPPELLFVHGGHTDQVVDIAWNPNEPWCMASAAEDNVLQVWTPASTIYAADEAVIKVDEDLE